MKRNILITITACFLMATTVLGQNLKVELADTKDNRGLNNFSECAITLKLSGSALQNAELIKFDTAFIAVDDLGTKLSKKESMGFHAGEFEEVELEDNAMKKEIKLLNPPRKASLIKLLKGKVYIYNTSLDPKSKINAKGFINRPNQSLLTVKDPSFDVLYIDAEAYKFMQQAEKEKVNKQIALLNPQGQQAAKEFVNGFFESLFTGAGPNALHFYVKDLNAQLLKFEFKDEKGELVEPGMTMTSDTHHTFGFRKPVTQEWQVTLLLITPKSLITAPFELKNITLP
jgi:hypothetical protein